MGCSGRWKPQNVNTRTTVGDPIRYEEGDEKEATRIRQEWLANMFEKPEPD